MKEEEKEFLLLILIIYLPRYTKNTQNELQIKHTIRNYKTTRKHSRKSTRLVLAMMFCFECYQKGYASRAKVSKHVVIKRKEQNAEPSKDARIHILNNTGLTIQIYKELIQFNTNNNHNKF